jgi:ABC-type polysaccharide/polyol phosphate transport system ATPase subunit
MVSIVIEDASVSYFVRKLGEKGAKFERGSVGAPVVVRPRYLEIEALSNVTLTFRSGDRVGLIGTNGSGKSTLLKLVSGALGAQSGTIRIEGRVSPQFSLGAGLKGALSGRRNTELKCLYMGTPQRSIAARVEEIRELSGLGGYFELPVETYSTGMRSRLVMSMLRLVRPEILVMDEWIGANDRGRRNKAVSELQQDVVQSASLVIMASHSQRILADWTNKLVWLDAGKVRAVGTMDDVYPQYEAWIEETRSITY